MRLLLSIYMFCFLALSGATLAQPPKIGLIEHEEIAAGLSMGKAFKQYQSLLDLGERSNATPYANRVYTIAKSKLAENPKYKKTFAAAAINYGRLLVYANRKDKASKLLSEGLKAQEELYGSDALELMDTLMDLGHAKTKFLKHASGNKYYDRAIAIAKENSSENSAVVAQLYFEMSEQMLVNGSGPRRLAIKKLTEAQSIFNSSLGEGHARTALASYRLGEIKKLQGKYSEAAPLLESATKVFDEQSPLEKYTIKAHSLLISAYEHLGKGDKATQHCQAVGKIKEARKEKFPTGFSLMPLHIIQPHYPPKANRRGIEGFATIELTVSKEGRTKDFRTLRWHGSKEFAKAAVKAARKFRYAVQFKDGDPIETQGVRYKFTFELTS